MSFKHLLKNHYSYTHGQNLCCCNVSLTRSNQTTGDFPPQTQGQTHTYSLNVTQTLILSAVMTQTLPGLFTPFCSPQRKHNSWTHPWPPASDLPNPQKERKVFFESWCKFGSRRVSDVKAAQTQNKDFNSSTEACSRKQIYAHTLTHTQPEMTGCDFQLPGKPGNHLVVTALSLTVRTNTVKRLWV